MANFCPECGNQLKGDEMFCGNCGATLQQEEVYPVEVIQKQSNLSQIIHCPYCGEEINALARKCKHCGEWLDRTAQPQTIISSQVSQTPTPVIVNNYTPKSNGTGTAGLVFAILGLIFCWIPVLNWILFGLGGLLSFIGLFFSPRGAAFAGFVISIITLLLNIALVGFIAALFS